MQKSNPLLVVVIGLIALIPFIASAQPILSGPQSGSLGPGTYLVVGDCQVLSGNSLVITPGTTLLHTGYYTWYITGEFNAVGTESEPIQFLQQESIPWGGLRFENGHSGSSLLEWCAISHCSNTGCINPIGGAVFVEGSGLTVRHCTLSYCEAGNGGGIAVNNASDVLVDHCIIENCTAGNGGGIDLFNASNVQIANCTIRNNTSNST